jgi:hypothetical protein
MFLPLNFQFHCRRRLTTGFHDLLDCKSSLSDDPFAFGAGSADFADDFYWQGRFFLAIAIVRPTVTFGSTIPTRREEISTVCFDRRSVASPCSMYQMVGNFEAVNGLLTSPAHVDSGRIKGFDLVRRFRQGEWQLCQNST